MPKPPIVPPTPTVTQPSSPQTPVTPVEPSAHDSVENVQNIFDRVFPEKGVKPLAKEPSATPERTQRPPISRQADVGTPPPAAPEPKKAEPGMVPSFIEEALRTEKPPAAA